VCVRLSDITNHRGCLSERKPTCSSGIPPNCEVALPLGPRTVHARLTPLSSARRDAFAIAHRSVGRHTAPPVQGLSRRTHRVYSSLSDEFCSSRFTSCLKGAGHDRLTWYRHRSRCRSERCWSFRMIANGQLMGMLVTHWHRATVIGGICTTDAGRRAMASLYTPLRQTTWRPHAPTTRLASRAPQGPRRFEPFLIERQPRGLSQQISSL
jgi:hypothetical protein